MGLLQKDGCAQNGDDPRIQRGDKLRVKRGQYKGIRGYVDEVADEHVVVVLDTGERTALQQDDITNYSLAARRAWKNVPHRAVGRPRARDTGPKKTVSVRIDVEVWRRLGEAVEHGQIPSREKAVNDWLRERLDGLLRE